MNEIDEVVRMICPDGVRPEDYDRAAPGFSGNLRRLVRAELARQRAAGSPDPVADASLDIVAGSIWLDVLGELAAATKTVANRVKVSGGTHVEAACRD